MDSNTNNFKKTAKLMMIFSWVVSVPVILLGGFMFMIILGVGHADSEFDRMLLSLLALAILALFAALPLLSALALKKEKLRLAFYLGFAGTIGTLLGVAYFWQMLLNP